VHVIPVDDRQPRAKSPARILPAFSASMISHGALLLCLTLAFHETRQRESTLSTAAVGADATGLDTGFRRRWRRRGRRQSNP
jgi:hypothetical protein